MGRLDEVDEIHRRLLKLLSEGRMVENRLVVRTLWKLVAQYRIHQQWAKVDQLAGAVLAAGRKQFKEESVKVVTVHDEWARSLMQQGRFAEAEEHNEIVVDVRRNHGVHGRLFSAMVRLGYCFFKQGKQMDRAELLMTEGCQELDKRWAQFPEIIRLEIVGSALQKLGEFYTARGLLDRAAECTNKLTELERKEGRPLLAADFLAPD